MTANGMIVNRTSEINIVLMLIQSNCLLSLPGRAEE